MNIKKYFIFLLIFWTVFQVNNLNASEKNYYQDIVNDWYKIFPDQNRNAAGPKFFKYILDKDITFKDFEKASISDFSYSKKCYINSKIKNLYKSLRSKDFFIIPFCILFGLSLDGLYHIGHMLSFGIAAIVILVTFNNEYSSKLRLFLLVFGLTFSLFNVSLKYSKSQGVTYYENNNYRKAVPYFNYIIDYYPLEIGKYHAYLSVCYYQLNEIDKGYEHYIKAKSIIKDDYKLNTLDDLYSSKKVTQ